MKLIQNGYDFKTQNYIRDGYSLFIKNLGGFLGFYAIFFVFNLLLQFLPGNYWILIGNFFQPIITAGIVIVANEVFKGNNPPFSKFFESFKFYVTLLLLFLISGIIIVSGLIFLIVPGIYFWVSFYLAPYFVIFLGYDWWPSLILSHNIVSKNWWNIFVFSSLVTIISLSGLLLFGVGVLFTVPLSLCITYCAFEDIVGGAIRKYSTDNVNVSLE